MSLVSPVLNFVSRHLTLVTVLIMGSVVFFNIISKEKKHKAAKKKLVKTFKSGMTEPMSLHPEIDPVKCAGCGACTSVCPEGDILQLINGKAVLVGPTKCVGHGECERACPFGAIDLVFGTKTRGVELPRVSGDYETNVPGLYIAGELGGMGLIRNAIRQGELAALHAVKNIKSKTPADCDILVVGAGPAGLSASLVASQAGVKYTCLEQNSLGGTVYNFPRQKVVMTHPATLPGFGKMKFPNNKVSKEELLAYWDDIRRKAKLNIAENSKFESIEKHGDIFKVKSSTGDLTAKKVILCMGVRGSPRRLGLPNEDSAKVAYNLLDPEQYQGQHVAVVGGGNAGLEAAQYLANPKYKNKVTLLVRGAGFDRANEENINLILNLQKSGHLQVWYESSVKAISAETITVARKSGDEEIKNNYLFIFAGAEMPFKFLMSLGIEIDKSFGERKMTMV